jgi:hypothetical protein
MRRQIQVGNRIVTGTVCEQCTIPIVIYPKAAMAAHVALHDAAALGPNRLIPQPAPRYRRGRPPRAGNKRRQKSAPSGIIYQRRGK